MKLKEIKARAFELGLDPDQGRHKADIIKAIQKAEGNIECFGTDPLSCGQMQCLWRKDCLRH